MPVILADSADLSFITARIVDSSGTLVPAANNNIKFEMMGPGEIVATDNGNPADMVAFSSASRAAFGGLALAIVRRKNHTGPIVIKAIAAGLAPAEITISPAR